MLIITNRFDLRNIPSACTVKISTVSPDVVSLLVANEDKKICIITEMEIIENIKKDMNQSEFIMEPTRRKFNKGEKILHVSYYRPKTGPVNSGKTEYRLITIV